MSPLPIAVDTDGETSPPRRNGELVFDAPWQGRAFGLCVGVLEREQLSWDDFRMHLVPAIAANPTAAYYDNFAVALDNFLIERGLVSPTSPVALPHS